MAQRQPAKNARANTRFAPTIRGRTLPSARYADRQPLDLSPDDRLRLLARLPQRQPHLAGVLPDQAHRVLDPHRVAVEEQALDEREEPQMHLGGPGEVAGLR